jgi:predicted HicB family RNase H-like nuclease
MENTQKAFNVRMDKDLHFELRVLCIKKNISMQKYINEAVKEKMSRESK